jgi:hypothetical protein
MTSLCPDSQFWLLGTITTLLLLILSMCLFLLSFSLPLLKKKEWTEKSKTAAVTILLSMLPLLVFFVIAPLLARFLFGISYIHAADAVLWAAVLAATGLLFFAAGIMIRLEKTKEKIGGRWAIISGSLLIAGALLVLLAIQTYARYGRPTECLINV